MSSIDSSIDLGAISGPHADFDWSTATVKVAVKVCGTASVQWQEVDLPLTTLLALAPARGPSPRTHTSQALEVASDDAEYVLAWLRQSGAPENILGLQVRVVRAVKGIAVTT